MAACNRLWFSAKVACTCGHTYAERSPSWRSVSFPYSTRGTSHLGLDVDAVAVQTAEARRTNRY
jgi:hypothetical protein